MKQVIVLMLAVMLMLCGTVSACPESFGEAMAAVDAVNQWYAELRTWADRTEDEMSISILSLCRQQLLSSNTRLLLSIKDSVSNPETSVNQRLETDNTPDVSYLRSEGILLEDEQGQVILEVLFCDDYIYLTSVAYDASGESTDFQMVEIARRTSGEQLLLMIQYNADFSSTARYAVLKDDQGTRSVHTETFGRVFDVNLDVAAWKDGMDFEEWGRRLLYPPN